ETVHLVKQAGDPYYLVLDLVFGQEDVGVVLGKAPYPEHTMESTAEFMAMNQAQFSVPQGQFPVGVRFQIINQNAAGAVHGLDCEILSVNDGGIHILLIVIPVAGGFPQSSLHNLGSGNFHVAPLLMNLPPVVNQGILENHSLGQVEGETRSFIPESKET